MTVQRRSNNIPHTLCICTTLAFLIYCLSLLLKLELWQLDQVCAKFVKGILFFLQLWIIDRQQLGKDSIMKMDEVQKFAGISPFCYSNVLAWFIWLLFCRKKYLYENVFRHYSAWNKLRGAEADGNLQQSGSCDGCSETVNNHYSKCKFFHNSWILNFKSFLGS